MRRFRAPLWIHLVNWAWCIGIIYSTLAVRQHVVVDVAGGLALGGLAAWLSLRRHVPANIEEIAEIEEIAKIAEKVRNASS